MLDAEFVLADGPYSADSTLAVGALVAADWRAAGSMRAAELCPGSWLTSSLLHARGGNAGGPAGSTVAAGSSLAAKGIAVLCAACIACTYSTGGCLHNEEEMQVCRATPARVSVLGLDGAPSVTAMLRVGTDRHTSQQHGVVACLLLKIYGLVPGFCSDVGHALAMRVIGDQWPLDRVAG